MRWLDEKEHKLNLDDDKVNIEFFLDHFAGRDISTITGEEEQKTVGRMATRPDGTKTPAVRKMRCDENTAWRIGLKRAGIEDFRFHDLRHTWASWLIQSGVPLSALQEMGGWESIEMVQRYAHLAPNHLTEHARQIDAIFGSRVPNLSHVENLKAGGE